MTNLIIASTEIYFECASKWTEWVQYKTLNWKSRHTDMVSVHCPAWVNSPRAIPGEDVPEHLQLGQDLQGFIPRSLAPDAKNSRHLIWHTFKSRRSFPYEAYQISTWFILNAYLACFLILPKSHFWVVARQESRFCRTLIKDEGIVQRLHIRQMHSGRILNKSVWGLMGKGKFLIKSSCISCLTSSICTDPYSWLGKITLRFNITASTWH